VVKQAAGEETAVTWQSNHNTKTFLHEGLGRTSTRQLSQPLAGGNWVVPHYSRRPMLPTSISVRDFENPRLPQANKTVTLWYTTKVFPLWYTTKVFPLWETQREGEESEVRTESDEV